MKFLLALSSLLISVSWGYFVNYTPDTYPDSVKDFLQCGLYNPGLACDPNQILGNRTVQDINIILKNIQHSTNCSCSDQMYCNAMSEGYTVSVAVVEKISDGPTPDTSVEHRLRLAQVFADTLRTRLNRGQCQDDALILISRLDHVIYTSVGATAGKVLTEKVITMTDDSVRKDLDKGDYFSALSAMLLTYQQVLEGKPIEDVITPWYHPLPLWAVYAIGGGILAVVLLLVMSLVFCLVKRRKSNAYTVGRVNYNSRL